MLKGTAPSTNATYARRQRQFVAFCEREKIPLFPICELTLLKYVGELDSVGVKSGTVSGHLSALRHFSLINGLGDPLVGCERLGMVKRGIARESAPAELRAAVVSHHILAFLDHLDLTSFDDAMFFAMCCCGFFGFMRFSELTYPDKGGFIGEECLTVGDITWLPNRFDLFLKRSKTDRRNDGVIINFGLNDTPVCPYKALKHYLNLRDGLLPPFNPASSPLFVELTGLPVRKAWFAQRLADLAVLVGIEGKVTPHSLRIGAATAAWRAGFSDSQIQAMGRWKSQAFLKYLRIDSESLSTLSTNLGASLLG